MHNVFLKTLRKVDLKLKCMIFFVFLDDLTTKSDKKCQICPQKVSHFMDTPKKILSPRSLMGIPISKNG